ncbi:MAG TPA: hypothetical protein VN310_10970 [Candidatus Dormibacteraeota bacterium]|jgi:hypothetical protein|nr:hypothetical protein [Candidatus Dormibacteraeota bacterium]
MKTIHTVLAIILMVIFSNAQVRNAPPKSADHSCVDEVVRAMEWSDVVLSENGKPIPIHIEAQDVSDEVVAAEVIKGLFPDWFTFTSSISAPKLSITETTKELSGRIVGNLQVKVVVPTVTTFRFGQERHVVAMWMGAAGASGLAYYGPNDRDYRRQVVHDVVYEALSQFRDNITHDAPPIK